MTMCLLHVGQVKGVPSSFDFTCVSSDMCIKRIRPVFGSGGAIFFVS